MLKRHEVEILLKAGHCKAEVARLAGVSLRSVNRIAEEAPVVHVDDVAEREKRRIGRSSIVEDFRKPVVKILEETPDLPSLEILRRVREAGYQARKITALGLGWVEDSALRYDCRGFGVAGSFWRCAFASKKWRIASKRVCNVLPARPTSPSSRPLMSSTSVCRRHCVSPCSVPTWGRIL
jgi:hypothetical protein